MKLSDRRSFLVFCLSGALVSMATAAIYAIFSFLSPIRKDNGLTKVQIKEKDFPSEGVKFFEFEGKSAVIVKRRDGNYIALSAICTHLGCIVQWQKEKEQFLCPCHAGLYNIDGSVISGPPPKPLRKLTLNISDGLITVG